MRKYVFSMMRRISNSKNNSNQVEIGSDAPCGIDGNWINQLGSTMKITCRKGTLRGRYRSSVGEASDFYELSGRYTMTGANQEDCVVGFSVAWNNDVRGNSNSTTSWTGLYYASERIIHTHWILTRYREIDSLWATNLVGHDDFRRV
ncbi:hypothetical protein ACJMK2_014708 [Sinanodonta woodiana]|uniref:Uncharacterized protein n=1 Tax=Sinanodonta woodiana TaxID=1069815 RepID=A0ABD3V1H0_SINWO